MNHARALKIIGIFLISISIFAAIGSLYIGRPNPIFLLTAIIGGVVYGNSGLIKS